MLRRLIRRLRRAGFTNREIRMIWFQHDNAPPHTHHQNQRWLRRRFRNRFIGRGSRVAWPPRSPDLNPLDYFFWGKIKSAIYRHPVQNVEELMGRITDAVAEVTPEMLQTSINDLIRRANLCVEQEGGHFEHLLT